MNSIKVGDKVKVIPTQDSWLNRALWLPKNGLTGNVEALHKNGSIRVALHQFKNTSSDGLLSKTFGKNEIILELM